MSEMKIAMGDDEYSDTSGGAIGIINEYLKPLNLPKTYYSFNVNNVQITIIDPHIDYGSTSDQYQFIEQDLKDCFYQSKNRLDICCRTYTYVYFTFKTSW